MKILEFERFCSGVKNHAWYLANQGFKVRKPVGQGCEPMVSETINFEKKWQEEKELDLYVVAENKPKTQRQFFYWKYWEFLEKFMFTKFPPSLHRRLTSIDIGCGRATISQYLKNRIGMKELVMLDNDLNALEVAKKNVGEGVFVHSDVTDLPFHGETFDIAVSIGVVEHIDDYKKFFKEQYRVLKQWGFMVCLIIPEKSSVQKFNVFGTRKYKRSTTDIKTYEGALLKAGFPFYSGIWVAPYPIFTPIPMWLDKFITRIYLLMDKYKVWRGRKNPSNYSFKASPRWGQAYFLVAPRL